MTMTNLHIISSRISIQRSSWCLPQSKHAHNFFSTASGPNRVPTTLYRQLLCWCRRNDGIPFNPLPPLTLAPPQVNSFALARLKGMRSFLDRNSDKLDGNCVAIGVRQNNHPAHYALYTEDVVVKDKMITFPEIRDVHQLRSVIRAVYWLNNEHTILKIEKDDGSDHNGREDEGIKSQISLAFEAIKSCNQLSSNELDSRRKKRERSIEIRKRMEGAPLFHVGQVIKHKKSKWRGVIVGWAIDEVKNSGQLSEDRLTSLTTKKYEISEVTNDVPTNSKKVKYTILVDMNDSSLLYTSKSISLESQDDLEPVDHPCLRRISNHMVHQYFSKFDPGEGGYFTPNNVLNYVYPLDRFSNDGESTESIAPELNDACKAIINGIQEISHRLLSPVLELNELQENSDNEVTSLASTLLSSLQSMSVQNEHEKSSQSPLKSAVPAIERLNKFYAKLISLQWSHNTHKNHENTIEFQLGQTVKHKLFNFRGIVTAWDPKPHMDVSQWDGLQDVDNPNEKPFYHIRPDVNDCIREFGGPRSWRYVCQDNLEPYDLKHGRIELEMELDEEEWAWDNENGWFAPSEEIKFMHAENVGDNEEAIVATIQKLKEIISECFLSVQGGGSITGLFSLDDLFCLLKSAGKVEDATTIQDMIKEVFREFPDSFLRKQFDSGMTELIEGKTKEALETFSDIVATEPAYGEAWNKKATILYMLGEMDAARLASNKALDADPRNFQALSGIGLVEMDALNDQNAIDAFQKCLALNPWSIVSARLNICMNRRTRSSSTSDEIDTSSKK